MPKLPTLDLQPLTPPSGGLDLQPYEPEPVDSSFGSGYALPSLGDIYSTALKMPGRLIDTAVGGLDLAQAPWRSMAPGTPSMSSWLEDIGMYNPNWETEVPDNGDSPELKAAQEEHARAQGISGTAASYWRNPGLALLDIEGSIPETIIGGTIGKALKYAKPALSAYKAGALGDMAITAASQAAAIRNEKGDFGVEDFLPAVGSGAVTGLISGAGGKLANKFGLPDVDAFLADPTIKGTRRIPGLVGGGLIEGVLEEAPQSYNEQVGVNLATGRPWNEGAGSAAVSGAVSGFGMGSTMPMFRRGAPSVPTELEDVSSATSVEGYETDEEAVGTSFVVPEKDVTDIFIKKMRENGFVRAGMLPGGKTLFKAVNALDEPSPEVPPDVAFSPPETDLPLNPPTQAPFGQGTVEGVQPGETTGRVASMPVSADQALNTILNTRDEATVDAAANDFVQRVNKITNPQELDRMLQSIQLQPQTAVTRGLIDVVARRLNAIQSEVKYMGGQPGPEGGLFPEAAPPPIQDVNQTPQVPFDAGTYTEEDRARMAENLRQMTWPTPEGISEMSDPTNVTPFPDRPSVEDRKVESFHKGLMGDVKTRAAEMQQRFVELQQQYPNVPVEWLDRIQVAERNIARHLQSPNVDTANVQRMIADNQKRIGILTERMEAYNNAYMGGPSGIVPRTESGIENLRPQTGLQQVGNVEEDEWGPITPGHAESLLPQAPSQLPEASVSGEILPAQAEQTEFERLFGLQPGQQMTDQEIENVKEFYARQLGDMYGEDVVEGQAAVDEITGTIGDEKLHYPGVEDSEEKNITPTKGEDIAEMAKPYDPRIGQGVGQSFETALKDANDEDLQRMHDLMVQDVDAARAHLDRVGHLPNMSGVAKRRVHSAEGKLTTIKLEQDIRARESARYIDEGLSRMRVPGTNPATGRSNIALGGADPVVLDMLGTALYNRDSIATSVKELGQNAADERKISGNKEAIRIVFQEYAELPGQKDLNTNGKVYGKGLIVKDFGRGMTADQLYTIFTDVGKSGKRDEATASGGFGFAKAAPLLGGVYVKVESIVNVNGKLMMYGFEGDPSQMKDQVVGVPLHSAPAPKGAKTGFEVHVFFPADKNLQPARNLWKTTIENSPGLDNIQSFYSGSSIDIDDDIPHFLETGDVLNSYSKPHVTEHKSLPPLPYVDTINLPTADIKVHYELDNMERRSGEVVVLNNGLFALSFDKSYGHGLPLPNVPEKIVLDVNATVAEGKDGYPFGLNREDMDDDIKYKIGKWIDDNIVNPAQNQKTGEIQKLFDDLKPASPHQIHVFHDSGDRMTAAEKARFNNSPHVRDVALALSKMLGELHVLFNHGNRKALGDTVAFGFMQADSKSGGLNIPNPSVMGWGVKREYKILINMMGIIKDSPTPQIAAEEIVHIALHEFNHNRQRSEGGNFTWDLKETDSYYGTRRRSQIAEQVHSALIGPDGDYAPGIRSLLQEYTAARGRPDVTVDTLARQRAIEYIRKPEGPEGVSGDGGADGKKATPRAIGRFRAGLPKVSTYEKTRFILPDGERLGFAPEVRPYHDEQSYALGIVLGEAQESGIIRFRQNLAEVHAPITHEQAQHLADSTWNREATNLDPVVVLDVLTPSGKRTHQMFNEEDSPRKIRSWVNQFFHDFEEGWNKGKSGGSTTGAIFGGMPFKQAWSGVKQATGIGTGGANTMTKGQMNWIKEALAVPAGMTTTMDLSAPFRQGLSQIHTPQFWKAVVPMLKAGFSEQLFQQIDADLRNKNVMRPRRNRVTGKVRPSIAQEAGLKMFESASTGNMSQRAQATASRWLEQGIGKTTTHPQTGATTWQSTRGSRAWANTVGRPIRMSNRAYLTFLNHLKVNRFEHLMRQGLAMSVQAGNTGSARPGIFKQSYTPQEAAELDPYRNKLLAKEIADFVNTATGQGPLKTHILPTKHAEVSLEAAAGALQHIFFSPGLIASRVRMLNPNTYIMASPMVRRQYMMAALATGTAWMSALAMMKLGGGDEVEVNIDNMTSADWAKAKIGDTRMDPGGGFQQFLVSMARMIEGGTTSSASGEWREFGEGFMAQTQKSNLERFMSNKLNPVTKFAYDLASQSEYNPFHVYDRTAQLFVPLVIQDLIGLYYENPAMLPWMGPIMLGMGTQTYGRGESVGKLVAPENDWLASGGGIADLGKSEEWESGY